MIKKRKPASKPTAVKDNPKALKVVREPTESAADALAHTALRPTVQASLTLMDFNNSFGDMSINTLVSELGNQCERASAGDLRRPEAMLIAQAHTLDAIFNSLARRAAGNVGHYPETVELYLRLALRAQSQCRATLEALATIKNPPVVYARQANIAAGPQQVNNAAPPARARESEIEQSKVLEHTHAERLDTGASAPTIGADQDLAAVGAIDRSQDRGR